MPLTPYFIKHFEMPGALKVLEEKQTFPYSVSLVFQGTLWYGFLRDANTYTENYFGILHKSLNT